MLARGNILQACLALVVFGPGLLELPAIRPANAANAAGESREVDRAAPGEADIQWSTGRQAVSRINPTGRTIHLSMPLHYKQYLLGDISTRINASEKIAVPATQFLSITEILLKPDAHRLMATLPAPDGYIRLDELRRAGFDVSYDPGSVGLRIDVSVEQKTRNAISLSTRRVAIASANAATPSPIAAYLNMAFGIDYVSQNENNDTGIKNPRIDLQGALNIKNWVFETEATVESDDDINRQYFKRRGSRLVKDWPEKALRVKLGDVGPLFSGFQRGQDLLGITFEHNISKLQPGRDIRATSRRSFRIERDSDVDIVSNGQVIRRVRLAAGDYDLSDLPRTSGANIVSLIIRDDVGNENILEFTTFIDRALLAPGITEWALSGGIQALTNDGEPEYTSDDFIASGYYRGGVTERLSAEVNLQGDSDVVMAGGGVLYGSDAGLISVEGAVSKLVGHGVGFSINTDYHMSRNLLDWDGVQRNLNLSFEYRSDNFAAIGDQNPENDIGLVLTANYGQKVWDDIYLTFSTAHGFGRGTQGDYHRDTLSLSKTFGPYLHGSVSFGYIREKGGNRFNNAFNNLRNDQTDDDELTATFRLTWKPREQTRVSTVHDTYNNRTSVDFYQRQGKGVGSWNASMHLEYEGGDDFDDEDRLQGGGSFSYQANRANLSAHHSTRFSGLSVDTTENRTSMRVETSLACVLGMCAIGRPVSGPFALVRAHESIAGKRVLINPNGDEVLAYTDMFGPALVSSISNYSNSRISVDVDDLPLGYDLGAGAFDFIAPYKAGYGLTVGSNYTVTAYGTMVDEYGEPVSLLTGMAWSEINPERKVEIFTNRVGRFGAQGLAPGIWTVEMNTEPKSSYSIDVPEGTVGLFKTGMLEPVM